MLKKRKYYRTVLNMKSNELYAVSLRVSDACVTEPWLSSWDSMTESNKSECELEPMHNS